MHKQIERAPLSATELVAMVAAFMALNAMGIDIMLPAFMEITRAFALPNPNDVQLLLYAYLIPFGIAQVFYGPLSDSYGRRPVLLWALGAYLLATVLCVWAPTFEILLLGRALQGAAVASARVVAVAVVRDLMSGSAMARVMSLSMLVFLAVPMIAPAIGQAILLVGPWRWMFGFLLIACSAVVLWTYVRLPETRPQSQRRPFSPSEIFVSYGEIMRIRLVMGYAIGSAVLFGAMSAYLGTAPQLFGEYFHLGAYFPVAFATVAGSLAVAAFANARFVMRFGMRRIGHAALYAFTGVSVVHALLFAALGAEPIWLYLPLLCAAMLPIGMIGSNFSAIAMEPLGARAGAGAAFFGFVTTTFSAVFGAIVARFSDGTPMPLLLGMVGFGVGGVAIIRITERGRLFALARAG